MTYIKAMAGGDFDNSPDGPVKEWSCSDCLAPVIRPGGSVECSLGYGIKFRKHRHFATHAFEIYPAEPCPKPKTKSALAAAERKK